MSSTRDLPTPAPVVVIALDKFKGSLSAAAACRNVGAGIRSIIPTGRIDEAPIADGGDGTLDVLLASGFTAVEIQACGPTGKQRSARIGVKGSTAFIELAEVCGLSQLPGGRLQAMRSSTDGLGQAALAAIDQGATSITVGLGGSASTDGGMGLLRALGATVRDHNGQSCEPGAGGLLAAESLDLSGLDPRALASDWNVLVDVDSPLTGPNGAAQMFGPQKGLTPTQVLAVEAAMTRWGTLLAQETGRIIDPIPGSGAAGGTGAAIVAALNGKLQPGSSHILGQSRLRERLGPATVVVTGEGRWDQQTGRGKGPGAVLELARTLGVPVVIVAGSVSTASGLDKEDGILAVHQLRDLEPDLKRSMTQADRLLTEVGQNIGRAMATRAPTLQETV